MFDQSGTLLSELLAGEITGLLTFGGQDGAWRTNLTRAISGQPELEQWARTILAGFEDRIARAPWLAPTLALSPTPPTTWFDLGDDADGRADVPVPAASQLAGTGLGQLLAAGALRGHGLSPGHGINSIAGHSSGLVTAWFTARHASSPMTETTSAAVDVLTLLAVVGDLASCHPWARSGGGLGPEEATGGTSGPMLAVRGLSEPALSEWLQQAGSNRAPNAEVTIALQNAWDRFVLCGDPLDLATIAERIVEHDGVQVEYLSSPAPYHHPHLAETAKAVLERLAHADLCFTGELDVPLIDPADGMAITGGDLTERLVESMLARPVRWADMIGRAVGIEGNPATAAGPGAAHASPPITLVIDAGPSVAVARMTERALRGTATTVLALGEHSGVRALTLAAERPGSPLDYREFAPALSRDSNGIDRLVTRHTHWCGRSPVVLAGMTPTTVDVAIVAAAANAGHVAELAGGGQTSAEIFANRIDELSERLDEGVEVVFNALHLDPYLWDLHLGRSRLVQKARVGGAPICGVTVSGGIPELEDAVRLLDDLNDVGIWLNAFKPGDEKGLRSVLAIADATEHRLWIHLEGGLAGGHHGWSDLEQVLFATYHEIRQRPNVALLVGGGIADPDRVSELLDGTWAQRHGGPAMPVDGVLAGTVAMAVAESTASASVKQALVDTVGTSSVLLAGETVGGVTSGRSGLGADIHYLGNHAARVAAILEEVAGDPVAVADRHDEIVDALAGTAKPFFGDIASMTYAEVLSRFVELCALGRNGRYEDGAWLDVTHRRLFADLVDRWEARCCAIDEGATRSIFNDLDDFDDPTKVIETFIGAYPIAETAEVEPTDAAYLVGLCDRPGKPVPFVVVIDSDVRRRYLADSLWYSHDDRWDADQVLVIPGPAAVAHITEVDEPVASLMDRLQSTSLDNVSKRVDQLDSVSVVLSLPSLYLDGSPITSPIRRMASGAEWVVTSSDMMVEATCCVGNEHLTLEGPSGSTGSVTVSLAWPALSSVDGDGSCSFVVDVSQHSGVPHGRIDSDSWRSCQARLMSVMLRGAQDARQRTSERLGREGTAGGGRGTRGMLAIWPEVFELIASSGGAENLVRLVHGRHRIVRSSGHKVDRRVDSRWVQAGLEITTELVGGDTTHVDTFLIRRSPGDPDPDTADAVEEPNSGPSDEAEVPEDPDTRAMGTNGVRGRRETPRLLLAERRLLSPVRCEAYAALSGDTNPLHRSDLVARLAGLDGRIVHGMWTSDQARSTVIDLILEGDAQRLVDWHIQFLDVVLPDAEIVITATRTAVEQGRRVLEVEIRSDDRTVAMGSAVLAPQRTAYVFPGQGIQHQGMGRASRERSEAARAVWERAEHFCWTDLGFSLLTVVDSNPTSLEVRGPYGSVTHRHPEGVLHLTQFTQVAMATLAASQVAELREAGVFDEAAVIAGHSVGEYNALASIGGVLPLEAVLGIVWARGSAMHDLVPRDTTGASGYRLAVVRPHLAGLDEQATRELVDAAAERTGELCEVVNHNLRGRQYAVAGTVAALGELERSLGAGSSPGRSPYLEVPGIDVPFHSRALAPGVDAFREHLERALPPEIDAQRLIGRYIPNLYPKPFSLSRDYVDSVRDVCGGAACNGLIENWDVLANQPDRLARELLVELLAWQFASPVRWIETTDVMLSPRGLGVERLIEIGVGAAPTLANLTKAAVAAEGWKTRVFHVDIDEAEVFERTEPVGEPAEIDDDGGEVTGSDEPASSPGMTMSANQEADSVATGPTSPGTDGSLVDDAPVSLGDAVRALLCFSAGVRPDQLGTDSIDQLVDGASSRRNQVLMDLGKELNLGSVDGAHDAPLPELLSRLSELARGHRHPGPVLRAMIDSGVATTAGRLSISPSRLLDRVSSTWLLGPGWLDQCRLEIALGTRNGTSRRGGELTTLQATQPDDLVDEALQAIASRLGVALTRPGVDDQGQQIGAAAMGELLEGIGGAFNEASNAAISALEAAIGVQISQSDTSARTDALDDSASEGSTRLATLDAEHGPERAEAVRSIFDPRRVQMFSSSVAWARADLDRIFHDPPSDPRERTELIMRLSRFSGADERFDETVAWYIDRCTTSSTLNDELGDVVSESLHRIRAGRDGADPLLNVSSRTVLISGASPGSIGEEVTAVLLASGATVVVLTSASGRDRRRAWRDLERRHAGPGARLFVVPANLASFRDIDGVLDWLADHEAATDSHGEHPGLPDVIVPFAAPGVLGDAADTGARQELELRIMLLGVERLVARCAELVGQRDRRVLTAVLPMSPNHGLFGGDGAYGHAKAGLEVLSNRRAAEHQRWGRWCHTIDVEIGWVRGTNLMGLHDRIAVLVEEQLGITTFSAEDVGGRIGQLCEANGTAIGPGRQKVDLTGGLDLVDPELFARVVREAATDQGPVDDPISNTERSIRALPTPLTPEWRVSPPNIHTPPRQPIEDMVVICGIAEIGPWGSASTRASAERDGDLSARAVLELAVRCGLVEWSPSGSSGRWIDVATDSEVDECDIAAEYREEVLERCGIRRREQTIDSQSQVFTERPIVVAVGSVDDAQRIAASTPGAAVIDNDGSWSVALPAGSTLFASHPEPLPRSVTAPIPDGMSPVGSGVPSTLASSIDPVAAWFLATTAEAFVDASTRPEELLQHVAANRIACTQGTGMGGMDSLRTLHLAPRQGLPHANDVLQEALGNVPAAHVVQAFVGSTGPMIHPVGACATAGVSLEVAVDLLSAGRADVVVGGGFDDLSPEGIIGFAEMSATVDDSELDTAGFNAREMSRPGDRARAGFVESQGGGAFLVCRGSVAAELGLPVRAVVIHAASHGDGLATSIPAPGPGAFESASQGPDSPLGRALAAHGLSTDDIELVSKHDTSTRANDPNEAEIHERIQMALGRSAGNPLRVVSQKALTGHAKGGSALWQLSGLCDIFDDGIVPGNPNLDSVDPQVQPGSSLVVDHRSLRLRDAPRAALLTSLGFGHVSVVAVLAHPAVFHSALRNQLGDQAAEEYRTSVRERERIRLVKRLGALVGGEQAFRRRSET